MSPFSLAAFLSLVAFVVFALLLGVWWSGHRLTHTRRWRRVGGVAVGLGLWLAVPFALAETGVLSRFDAVPPPAMVLNVLLVVGTVAFAFSPLGTSLARGVPLAALVAVQGFRLPLELLLHRLYAEGVLPVQMTYEGWNFDILTGLLALVVGGLLWRGVVSERWAAAWNVLGLVLLTVVVVTAVLSLPTPFQRFTAEPTTRAVVTAPLVWLPAVLVMGALLGHLLVIRELREPR